MTVDRVYSIINYIINKNLGQGDLTPSDFNNIINLAQVDFLDYLLGEFQQYQGGRPVAKVQFGMNESVRQRLTPFINVPTTLTPDITGFAPYPPDYQQGDAMYDSVFNRIRYVQQHKLYSYLNSTIDPVISNPIFLIVSGGFIFYPNQNTNGTGLATTRLSYVSTPPDIKWDFIPDGNGRPVYAPGTSADPEWYDIDMNQVISRALRMCGVNLQVEQISRYADEIKVQGQ